MVLGKAGGWWFMITENFNSYIACLPPRLPELRQAGNS